MFQSNWSIKNWTELCSKCCCNMLESEKSPDITCHWQGPKSYYASLISLLIYMSCKLHEFHIRCSQISCKFATSAYTTFHIHNIDIVTESILLLGKLPLQLSQVLLWNKYPSCRHNDKICPNGFRARRSKWTAPNLRYLTTALRFCCCLSTALLLLLLSLHCASAVVLALRCCSYYSYYYLDSQCTNPLLNS